MPELMGLNLTHNEEKMQTPLDSNEPVTMSAAHIQEDEDNSTSPLDLITESTHGSTRDNAHQLITIPAEEQRALNSPKDQFWSKAVEKLRKNKNVELSITEGQGMTEFKVVVKEVTYCEETTPRTQGTNPLTKGTGCHPCNHM